MRTHRAKQWCTVAFCLGVLLGISSAAAWGQGLGTGGVNVLTWHNDTSRTGQNLNETILTYNTITPDTFGQLCSAQLDGQVYAQPLVVTNATIEGTNYGRVVYVVTMNDTLYAIDGDPTDGHRPCKVIKSLPFLTTQGLPTYGQFAVDCHHIGANGCQALGPTVGILGTPVINISNGAGTIYLVTETQDTQKNPQTWYHYLYAVNVQSLKVTQSIQICGSGCGAYSSTRFSHDHIQRPGLLLANCGSACNNKSYVYVAFSMMDGTGWPYPNGAVFGYNAARLVGASLYYQTSTGVDNQTSYGNGIWQAGAAPAYGPDKNGKNWIYLNTANGTFDLSNQQPPNTDAGDTFLKLNPKNLTVTANTTGYFTPADQFYRYDPSCNPSEDGNDIDFGSGGVMLIPNYAVQGHKAIAVSGDKEQALWFIDRTRPGGHITACDGSCTCNTPDTNIIEKYAANHGQFHNNPALWQSPTTSYIYAAGFPGGPLFQYALCAKPTTGHVVCSSLKAPANFSYGSTPTVSASAQATATDAVVWAINKADGGAPEGTKPGVLYAFDAVSMKELYDSNECKVNTVPVDQIAPATKFSVPTVANSFVYVGAQELQNGVNHGTGTFYIFGLLSRTCS
jgi:hypothetical protein